VLFHVCNTVTDEELVLRHIRDGVEFNPIDANHNYDFDFQQINFIPEVKFCQ